MQAGVSRGCAGCVTSAALLSASHPPLDCGVGLVRHARGNPALMEERKGSEPDRLARAAGRGRDESAPWLLHAGVIGAVGALVFVILAISFVLWAVLR